jgi:hypothetical protein
MNISGENILEASAVVSLERGNNYVGIAGSSVISISSLFGSGDEATITITVEPI